MSTEGMQFWVAVVAVGFLGLATLVALVGEVFFDGRSELTFALVTALTAVTGAASAYLFRLNNRGKG